VSNILVNIKGLNSQEFPKGVTPLQIMTDTKGVSKDSIICKVDGVLTDLSAALSNDCDLQFMDAKSKDGHSVLFLVKEDSFEHKFLTCHNNQVRTMLNAEEWFQK